MALTKSDRIMMSAENLCSKDGARFTLKRKEIFKVMVLAKKALSAYEIADRLKETASLVVPIMSIYRILDFLEQRVLIHKISSINKYAVCAHISCDHEHNLPRLAVCHSCQSVDEIASNLSVKDDLQQGLDVINFRLESPHLELIGLCSNCSDE